MAIHNIELAPMHPTLGKRPTRRCTAMTSTFSALPRLKQRLPGSGSQSLNARMGTLGVRLYFYSTFFIDTSL
jgi:hypothetical protein